MSVLLVLENGDKGMLRACWPAGLEKSVYSVLMRDSCLKNKLMGTVIKDISL